MSDANMTRGESDGERPETMGRRLAALRALRGWTQEEAAALGGTTQGNLSKIERDEAANPPIGTITRLAQLYGVTLDYLVRGNAREQRAATVDASGAVKQSA